MSPATFLFELAGPFSQDHQRFSKEKGKVSSLEFKFWFRFDCLTLSNFSSITYKLSQSHLKWFMCGNTSVGDSPVVRGSPHSKKSSSSNLCGVCIFCGRVECGAHSIIEVDPRRVITFYLQPKFSWCIFLSCANILSGAWNTHSSSDKHQWQQSAANRYFTLNNTGFKIYINRKQKVIALMERLQTGCLHIWWCLSIDLSSLSYSCSFSPSHLISHCPCSHFPLLEWL